jgi:hypothetical protein
MVRFYVSDCGWLYILVNIDIIWKLFMETNHETAMKLWKERFGKGVEKA